MSRSNSGNNDSSRKPSDDKPSLRERMSRDLQLRGMARRTHDGYLREVRKLAAYYNTPPDQLSEQQVAEYLLYLINECNFAPGSLGVAYSGIKFFYGSWRNLASERESRPTRCATVWRLIFSKPVSRCAGSRSSSDTAACRQRSSICT